MTNKLIEGGASTPIWKNSETPTPTVQKKVTTSIGSVRATTIPPEGRGTDKKIGDPLKNRFNDSEASIKSSGDLKISKDSNSAATAKTLRAAKKLFGNAFKGIKEQVQQALIRPTYGNYNYSETPKKVYGPEELKRIADSENSGELKAAAKYLLEDAAKGKGDKLDETKKKIISLFSYHHPKEAQKEFRDLYEKFLADGKPQEFSQLINSFNNRQKVNIYSSLNREVKSILLTSHEEVTDKDFSFVIKVTTSLHEEKNTPELAKNYENIHSYFKKHIENSPNTPLTEIYKQVPDQNGTQTIIKKEIETLKKAEEEVISILQNLNSEKELEQPDRKKVEAYFNREFTDQGLEKLAESLKSKNPQAINLISNLQVDKPEFYPALFDKLGNSDSLELLKKLIEKELNLHTSKDSGTLFRGNSATTRMISVLQNYVMDKQGFAEIRSTLEKLMPDKPYDFKSKDDQARFLSDMQKVMDEVVNITSNPKFPPEIKSLASFWKEKTTEKFGDVEGEKMGTQLFILRYLNPIFLTIENAKVNEFKSNIKQDPNSKIVIGFSKLLQNLANKVTSSKEEEFKFTFDATALPSHPLNQSFTTISKNLTSLTGK